MYAFITERSGSHIYSAVVFISLKCKYPVETFMNNDNSNFKYCE